MMRCCRKTYEAHHPVQLHPFFRSIGGAGNHKGDSKLPVFLMTLGFELIGEEFLKVVR
jgi:hypothetical protein